MGLCVKIVMDHCKFFPTDRTLKLHKRKTSVGEAWDDFDNLQHTYGMPKYRIYQLSAKIHHIDRKYHI
ncbi:hypothetical protein M378DRAFT_162133 [Amanita muscaria Koide BX008]|uniref:Uncharacterized protein n=1 Tax=Amanita muscaria (strain Koide BX008) TaxID=946122 RepID=A0A0C2SQI0_AMAMK|nr:hypothetical protein M378DRAFT_162133 [Amanita muscaria Koide BX008]